ncbi:MAG: clostripain-related cysteine peptidase [Candidatus Babeliales bacterium]|nr:clostripain-related cysteine peptidase [Candidatus Babeliales bacterium]
MKLVTKILLFMVTCSTFIFNQASPISNSPTTHEQKNVRNKKNWTLMVYIAADNNLNIFAWGTIRQLAKGANDNVNIVVQLNEPGRHKKTERYLIEKNNAILLNKDNTKKLDSGDPQTLIDFGTWVIQNYPAENYMIVLSDHGSGAIDLDRHLSRLINPTELFVLNPSNLMLELDRSISFLDFFEKKEEELRGICFDENFQSYLNNQKLDYAFKKICESQPNFKFNIIGLDACLMQMIEISNLIKPYADILVASPEVELGPGWRYDTLLKPFSTHNLDPVSFAKHIVKAYEQTYIDITNDYTLSAIDLHAVDKLEKNINGVAEILIEIMATQKNGSIKKTVKDCKKNISFEEPSYIDLTSFYENLLNNISKFNNSNTKAIELNKKLETELKEGIKLLKSIILENVRGKNITYSKGVSIYFPEKTIHNSYIKTSFAQTNQWVNLLLHYINSKN